ncbi:hypothetical protein [Nakamurella leprariae]|uniref:hypothetical protein n=1 Tax=Nakamurella leprariae TaxID=2803911 RepID=UPI001964F688|nr:hypothetical protein [Nakamurella leprariae]
MPGLLIALPLLVLGAGVLVGVAPLLDPVSTGDGSPLAPAGGAAWAALLPAVLVLVLTAARRPVGVLAAAAGAGLAGVSRLVSDLPLLTAPDLVVRPELIIETTDRARPLTPGAGAWLVVLADVLLLVAGGLAARWWTRRGAVLLAETSPSGPAGPDFAVSDPAPGAAAETAAPAPGGLGTFADAGPGLRIGQNGPTVLVGFLAAVAVMVGALLVPVTGEFLALRLLPPAAGLWDVLAALAAVLVVAVAVLMAAAVPRPVALAGLAGVACVLAVPGLTALLAGLTRGVDPASGAWWTLTGAVLLVLAAALSRRPGTAAAPSAGEARTATGPDGRADGTADLTVDLTDDLLADRPDDRTGRSLTAGGLALLAAVLGVLAWAVPVLQFDGAAPTGAAAAIVAPVRAPFLVAAVAVGIAAALVLPTTLGSRTGRAIVAALGAAGRVATAVLWAGPALALAGALALYAQVRAGQANTEDTADPLLAAVPSSFLHTWSAGWGLWAGVLSLVVALAAGIVAIAATAGGDRDRRDRMGGEPADPLRRVLAGVVGAGVVVAGCLPTHRTAAGGGPTLLTGYDLAAWGVWAVVLAGVGALVAAAVTTRPAVAAGALVAAAVVLAQRTWIPAAVRDDPGSATAAGWWIGWLAVAALLVAAVLLPLLVRRAVTPAAGDRA